MKNRLAIFGMVAALCCFIYGVYQMYLVRTDWMAVTVGLGFMGLFIFLSLMMFFLDHLETKFDKLTQVLSQTFTKLAEIDQKNYERYNNSIQVTFQGSGLKWGNKSEFDGMDLAQLKNELKKAEKEENYEKAAIIQRWIDMHKGGR